MHDASSDSTRSYAVLLHDVLAGLLHQKGTFTWFELSEEYLSDPNRNVLSLSFEDDPTSRRAGSWKVPPWFSNLLPEGRLREWVADEVGVGIDREMQLLARLGHDLSGAVRVLPTRGTASSSLPEIEFADPLPGDGSHGWRISLAGVALKLSMVAVGERLTMPAYGEGGDWIVKLPDPRYPDVPRNEFAMMKLASLCGIDVPEIRLVERSVLGEFPEQAWQSDETVAFAVRRFDRGPARELIHVEDLAQVVGVYPTDKYESNFETVGSLIYRGFDEESLREFARRLVFNILIGNGDAHLKNWSILYTDPRRPRISPAYDLVATEPYVLSFRDEDLGMTFGGTKLLDVINLGYFYALEQRLGAPGAALQDVARETAAAVVRAWPLVAPLVECNERLGRVIDASIARRSRAFGVR
jgi:serine/threonine-protein kinase HipA